MLMNAKISFRGQHLQLVYVWIQTQHIMTLLIDLFVCTPAQPSSSLCCRNPRASVKLWKKSQWQKDCPGLFFPIWIPYLVTFLCTLFIRFTQYLKQLTFHWKEKNGFKDLHFQAKIFQTSRWPTIPTNSSKFAYSHAL